MKIRLSSSTFLMTWSPEAHLTLNGQNIPFINHVKYIGVIFDKRITWRLSTGTITAKPFRTFIMIYSLFKSEHFCATIKLTLGNGLIRSVITYACPASELATETYLFRVKEYAKQATSKKKAQLFAI
jgi:hypothetical protein